MASGGFSGLFGRHVWEISRAQATLLAGIVQAPARYTPSDTLDLRE